MSILNKFHYNFIKLKYIVLALICRNGVIGNYELGRLLGIAPNLLWKYTKSLEKEGLINSKKIGSNKLWGPTIEGHGVFNEITTLLNRPIEYLSNLEANLNEHREALREEVSETQ